MVDGIDSIDRLSCAYHAFLYEECAHGCSLACSVSRNLLCTTQQTPLTSSQATQTVILAALRKRSRNFQPCFPHRRRTLPEEASAVHLAARMRCSVCVWGGRFFLLSHMICRIDTEDQSSSSSSTLTYLHQKSSVPSALGARPSQVACFCFSDLRIRPSVNWFSSDDQFMMIQDFIHSYFPQPDTSRCRTDELMEIHPNRLSSDATS